MSSDLISIDACCWFIIGTWVIGVVTGALIYHKQSRRGTRK